MPTKLFLSSPFRAPSICSVRAVAHICGVGNSWGTSHDFFPLWHCIDLLYVRTYSYMIVQYLSISYAVVRFIALARN